MASTEAIDAANDGNASSDNGDDNGDRSRIYVCITSSRNQQPLQTLYWLLDSLHPTPFSLPFTLYIRKIEILYPIISVLDRLSSVITTLDLWMESESAMKAILSYLPEPSKISGTLKWPLPNLSNLSL
ncbi:hypothetical protein FRB95_012662 [Tulasnella sp. JGI-2019a]|nr:hypothetical protein FRB95_012662 [Tulasnella sp. JGI-2019a]